MDISQKTIFIKQLASKSGFDYCGIAKAEKLDDDARRLEKWLHDQRHGTMHYMERYFDMRTDPRLLVPGTKSVIILLKNYYPQERQNPDAPKVSKYAYANDYHDIIRKDLHVFFDEIKNHLGDIQGRGFVDSAPVLERSWAQKSGLGWVGKNGMLINKQSGSFYFIATLMVDIELQYDDQMAKDYCGTCTKCIDHCPTDAILPEKVIDAKKCISYFTIELKENIIPEEMKGKFNNWMFGCDICNDVCPWNRFATTHNDDKFSPIREIIDFSNKDWLELTEESFKKIFKHSPLKRSKYLGIMRNLKFLQISDEKN